MKKTLRHLGDYKKETFLGPLFKLTEALLELFVPLVVAAIIDNGVSAGNRNYVFYAGLILGGLAIIGLACSLTAQYYAAKASTGLARKVRHALFEHIQNLSYSQLDEAGIATLITRMTSDVDQVQTGVNLTLRLLLRSPFVVFGAMIMAFTIDTPSAMIFVVIIPLLAAVVFGIMLASIPMYRKVQDSLDRVLGKTRENLSGARVVRAFGLEESETEDFRERNDRLNALQRAVGRVSALMNPMTYVLINGAVIVLVWAGAVRVSGGSMTQGQVVAMYNYMSQILVELIKLANLIINITKSVACANRIGAVLSSPSGQEVLAEGESGSGDYAVEFRSVALRYPGGGEEALSGISFAVQPGQTVGIIGGTGEGKSSLVNLIPRFYDATSGAVLVGGRDVRTLDPVELRSRIGIVPQKAALFKGTIRENLLWGDADADDRALSEAIAIAQATDIVAAKGGLEAQVEQNGRNLSGGQRQRLTIARALVRKPDILILDDSSSALDYATDAALRGALRSMEHSPTTFIVSQRTASIQHADLILVLDDGELVGSGTHEQLLNSCPAYREIYDSQFKKEAAAQ
ncbi:MAG: ABC transporter ATP-binding protein [Ruminococcaceae bacterium]|nr:ABC transporter ATP-binding protein [Oscillospiraceae bacterium]